MKIVLLLVMIALLWGGGQGVYTGLQNREPVSMTCAEYAKSRPEALWVKLSECSMDFADAAQRGSGDASELFIPLRPAQEMDDNVPATVPVIVLVSEDAEVLEFYNGILRVQDDQEALLKYLAANTVAATMSDFDGLVQFGIELSDDERSQVAALTKLDKEFVMLEHNANPEMLFSAVMLGIGVLLLVGLVVLLLRGRKTAPPTAPATAES